MQKIRWCFMTDVRSPHVASPSLLLLSERRSGQCHPAERRVDGPVAQHRQVSVRVRTGLPEVSRRLQRLRASPPSLRLPALQVSFRETSTGREDQVADCSSRYPTEDEAPDPVLFPQHGTGDSSE
jgi:hypothetical protein